jgi:hypothetical protein
VSKRVITGYKHIVKIEQYISDLYFTYQTDIIDVIGIKIGQGYYRNFTCSISKISVYAPRSIDIKPRINVQHVCIILEEKLLFISKKMVQRSENIIMFILARN